MFPARPSSLYSAGVGLFVIGVPGQPMTGEVGKTASERGSEFQEILWPQENITILMALLYENENRR
jgi:hypothetical protein